MFSIGHIGYTFWHQPKRKSPCSSVSIVTRLRTVHYGVRSRQEQDILVFFQNVHTDSMAHTASHSVGKAAGA